MNPQARGNSMNIKGRKATNTPIPSRVSTDVLLRLPAKSLMRFRCVCKYWNILIRDPKFVELHHTRSLNRPGGTGLIMSFKHKSSKLCFILTDYKGKPTRHSVCTPRYDRFSQVINGLVCLTSYNGVFLCNLYTRQIIALPQINLKLLNSNHSSIPSYLFGFDPSTKQYKVLNIWTIEVAGGEFSHEFDVYTLGTNSWRRINPPQYKFSSPFSTHNECICVNGVIFWIQHLGEVYKNKHLELFDVKDENFQRIPFPKDALEGSTNLIQVQGRLAITHWPRIRPDAHVETRMWILESYRHPVWKQETIIIPDGLTGIIRPCPAGTFLTGEILVMDNVFTFPSRFLFYDLKNKSYRDSTIYTHFLPLPEGPGVSKKWARFSHNEFKEVRGDDLLKLSITDQVENILLLKR